MADKMMRISGRDPVSGQAKALTVEVDLNGDGVLRVVDAAPYLAEIAGFDTASHTAPNVTTTSAVVLSANALRKYAIIVNYSDTEVFLKFGGSATVGGGIPLPTKYSSYEMSAMKGNLFTGDVYAIHASTGNKTLLITEGVEA